MVSEVATAVPYNREKDRFLLTKRSESTGMQPGKWDFPTEEVGNGDVDPEEVALRVLRDETDMTGRVLRTGDPFTVENEGREFLVHPALVLVDEEEPVLDSERTDYEWIETEELGNFETVNGLKEDLRRVDVLNE